MDQLRKASGTNSPGEAGRAVEVAPPKQLSRGRRRLAVLVFSAGYPLLGLALWVGTRRGLWTVAAIIATLGVAMSFVGWVFLYDASADADSGADPSEARDRVQGMRSFIALYARLGAIVILICSYTVVGAPRGWPMPQSVLGWLVTATVLLSLVFALPRRP